MSSISKMQIRGIRSFSPDRDETIEFYSPLTMIVGANGCGKTTIIESLKFSCTGSLPPNTKGGQSFVNDPGMTDATEVKAHIKLRFQNRSDNTCVSVRSLQVTKKRTKMEFKALEGVLRTTNDQGEKVSIGLKCTDMDRIFPENLGVSPAILENVIFCHQEESNWPMQEGMVLKKKFDDVFESTRYTKALEAFTKAKKEFQGKAKDLKAELMEYGAHLLSANQAKSDVSTCEENQEICRNELQKIADKLQRNEERMRSCQDILATARNGVSDLEKIQWKVNDAQRRVQDKAQSLESRLDGSDADLRQVITNFENTMQGRARELRTMQQRADSLAQEVSQLRDQMGVLNGKKGQAVLLQEQSKRMKDEQVTSSRALQRKYNLPQPNNNWTTAAARDYSFHVNNEVKRAESECQDTLSNLRRVVETNERNHSEIKGRMTKLDIELDLKKDEESSVTKEIDAKKIILSRMASSRNAIQQNQQEYEAAQLNHDEFNDTYQAKNNDLKRQIKDATDQIRILTEQIANDSQLLQDLSLHRNEIAAVDATLKQLNNESEQITSDLSAVFRTHRDVLQGVVEPRDCRELDDIIMRLSNQANESQRDYANKSEELTRLRNRLAANDALLSQEQGRVQKMQTRADGLAVRERDIHNLIHQLNDIRTNKVLAGTGFEPIPATVTITELAEIAKQTEDEARELLIIAKSGKVFLKRLKKSRANNNGSCPCCGQGMNAAVSDTYERNVKDLFTFGDEAQQGTVEEHKAVFASCTAIFNSVQDLHTSLLPLIDLREDIATAETKISDLDDSSNVLRAQIMSMEHDVQEKEQKSSSYNRVTRSLGDVNIRWQSVSNRMTEFQDKKKRQSQSIMGNELGGRSIVDLENLQRQRSESKDELQARKDRLQADEATLTKRMFAMKTILNEKEKALSDAKIEGNKYRELENAISVLQNKLVEIEARKSALTREREGVARELNEKQIVLNGLKSDFSRSEQQCNDRLREIRGERDAFVKLVESAEDVDKRYNELNLAGVTESLDNATRTVNTKEEEIRTLTPKINAINAELSSQEHTKRNVTANIELRANEVELQQLQQQLATLERNSGGNAAQIKTAEREYALVDREAQTLKSERDTLRGKLEVHNQQVIDLKAKLNNTTYRGIEEKHRRKNIEFETTNLAVLDLESYHNALDRALQNFHTLKIKEINKIIRELWQLIYKGQDIDMIELESGQDDATGAAATTAKGSRSYNYRVVMRKGDVPLDMRGRCSAGQKVLAAIVIRLALAETFCLNCGILALDEPTTNLDEPNKAGLAHALSRIILARSKQQNFQLICITHDEEFVKMMSDELGSSADFNLPEYYFRVYRQEEGNTGKFFSHIERVAWEDM